jgi:DNA (cytosine-5)-methyltransferase 1
MRSLELFAGAGGLAIGMARAGFEHLGVFERDPDSCEAIRSNSSSVHWPFEKWPVFQEDVTKVNFKPYEGAVQLVSGGPPCQPFSIGGKARGFDDSRDMFPVAARAIAEVKPIAFVFENVRGLLRQSFAKYFEYVLLRLAYPEAVKKERESWIEHLSKLERLHTHGQSAGLRYRVVFRLLNAADFGVPQKRERVFIVGFREDVRVPWSFPDATHSADALMYSQWGSGDYWEELRVPKRERPPAPSDYVLNALPIMARWRTVRDAIHDLPEPTSKGASRVPNHRFQPGARSYVGHTGSPLDMPAKTLKAGDHGVPGGENMLVNADGSVRYFTIRESARLQTFPDSYLFTSSWTESMRQIGNAVPVALAETVARSVQAALKKHVAQNAKITIDDSTRSLQPAR